MKQRLRYALAGGLLLLAIGVVGCGGSDNEEATTAEADQPTMVKAVYIEKGDKICQANYAKRGKILSSLSQKFSGGKNLPPQARLEAILVNQVMPIFREESEDLNELPLPDEGAEEAEKILAALERSIEGVEADPARSLAEGTGVEFKEAERLAHEYGFKWCGRS